MAKLIAQGGHTLDLPARRVTLGESPSCDIPLAPGLGLAACHFEIEPNAEGNYVIRDLSGGAGIMVNEQSVKDRVLQHGNVIAAGDLRLGFWSTAVEGEESSPFLPGVRGAADGGSVLSEPENQGALGPGPTSLEDTAPLQHTSPLQEELSPPAPQPPSAATPPTQPPLSPNGGPPPAWVSLAEPNMASSAARSAPSDVPVEHSTEAPENIASPSPLAPAKTQRIKPSRRRRVPGRRTVLLFSLVAFAGLAAGAARIEPVKGMLAPLWVRLSAWSNPPKPASRVSATASVEAETARSQSSGQAPGVTPKAEHNEVVKRLLNERTTTLFQADLRQLVPYYNATAAARNLPPQREMTEAFRKHYGILLDGFDRLTCLRARGKDEFVFILTSSSRIDLESVLGIPPVQTKDRTASKGASSVKSTRIYPIKTTGRLYGVAQYDPFTILLGRSTWIDAALNGSSGLALREALCMFPETASKNPGALIMVERIIPPAGDATPSAFQTTVSNLFFKDKGESRLTLTRNPDVKKELFVEQSSAALQEQASALVQAVKLGAPPVLADERDRKGRETAPKDSGEIITVTEASIIIPDGEALLREAIDSVARTFMAQSPSVELILAAQKAVLNFNQARLQEAPETQSVTGVAEALELLQNGIAITGRAGRDLVYQIDRLEPAQADEVIHLLALEEKAGLVFRPNTDQLSGSMLDLAVKARDYRNAELLISLWTAGKFTSADATDVNTAVRKVLEWATAAGARQRISVGLPTLTQVEYKNAISLLSIQNGQLTWRPGEEGYRTWLRRVNPEPKGDAKRIAGAFSEAQKAGAIPQGSVKELADAVRLINTGVRAGNGARAAIYHSGHLKTDELRAAARYLRWEGGVMRFVDR